MTIRARTSLSLLLVALVGALVFSSSASAAFPIAKNGKIYACYKAKGKGKGTLRVVRTKARCPKRWKKTSWYAAGATAAAPGVPGPAGPQGAQGQQGERGERGLPGTAGNVVVEDLEKQVTELLTKVQSLETVLKGVNNAQLKEAIAAVPVVDALCAQAKALNEQSGSLGTALGGVADVLDTLTPMDVPAIPTALPPFECP